MNQIFNVVIVGLGKIGLYYDFKENNNDYILTHTKACMTHPSFNLLGGVDIDIQPREDFKSVTGLNAFSNIGFFKLNHIDLVIISTPSHIRRSILTSVLNLDPQFILLEKPLALNLLEAEEILDMCHRRNIGLAVNYFRRFNRGMNQIKRLIDKKLYGRMIQGICYYSGEFLNNGSHIIDLLIFYFGLPLKTKNISQDHESFFVSCMMQYELFDLYILPSKMECSDGEFIFFFEKGKIRIYNWGEKIQLYIVGMDQYFSNSTRLIKFDHPNFENHYLLKYQYEVLENIRLHLIHRHQMHSDGKSAYQTLKVCFDILL